MKALSITGFVIGFTALAIALYNQFSVIEDLRIVEAHLSNSIDQFETKIYSVLWASTLDTKIYLGITAMGAGIIALLVTIAPIFKSKQKLAVVGGIIGLVAGIFGLLQSMA